MNNIKLPFKIRIISGEFDWYVKYIGQIFEVLRYNPDFVMPIIVFRNMDEANYYSKIK